MRIAIPAWEKRVSPILDNAGTLVLVDTRTGGPERQSLVPFEATGTGDRARFLRELAVDCVICGAVSRELKSRLVASGIAVLPNRSGFVEDVAKAYLERYTSSRPASDATPRSRINHPGSPGQPN